MTAQFYCRSAGGVIAFTEDHRLSLMVIVQRDDHARYSHGLDTQDLAQSYIKHCFNLPAAPAYVKDRRHYESS